MYSRKTPPSYLYVISAAAKSQNQSREIQREVREREREMANREVKIEKTEIVVRDGEERHPNPILCLLSRFPFFNFLQPKRDSAKPDNIISEKKTATIVGESGEEGKKPVVVKVPNPKPTDLPSLKLEGEECDRNTNPIVLWQVIESKTLGNI